MEETYNGWSNKATWQVVNWFPDFLRDFIDTNINWDELEANFSDDDIEEEEEEEEDLDHYDMRKNIKGYIE